MGLNLNTAPSTRLPF